MYSFLVLGIIPGTNIQITFKGWIYILVTALMSVALFEALIHSPKFVALVLKLAARSHEDQTLASV